MRRVLLAGTAVAVGTALAVVGWGALGALDIPPPSGDASSIQLPEHDEAAAAAQPAVNVASTAWSKPLQRPLVDPPPPEPPKPRGVAVKPPPAHFKLLGTFIEGDRSRALLQSAPNRIEVRRAGEKLEWATPETEVVSVSADQVVLLQSGREITLTLDKSAPLPIEDVHAE